MFWIERSPALRLFVHCAKGRLRAICGRICVLFAANQRPAFSLSRAFCR
jgi:hypothetical protein